MIITRQQREAYEAMILAPYAVKSRDSKGRVYPESEDPTRTAFQKDRDRILHTTAFRRLEYKTQVFVNYEGDYYRTRLTHTLEVAQIGRSLARALGANEDLVEAVCLSHDLGHSPFGHAGEHILNDLMKDHGGFDHNRQTFRIVTELEERYPGWKGLNLTHEVLEGIVKHESQYDTASSQGYDPNTRGSLEAQIANIADEMAYNAHDLDDGLRAGLLTNDQPEQLEIWQMVKQSIGWTDSHFNDMIRYRLIRRLIRLQINDVITATNRRLEETSVDSPEVLQALPENVICNTAGFARMNDELKSFLYSNLYRHYRVARMSEKAQRYLREIFEAYIKEPAQLPFETQSRIKDRGLHRAVADYIAGMTDRYALQEWERLFDPFTRP
ncbi:MAG: deoxyguanosinetriphosphate triphosphohydrolase [Anaerolineae bacterium]|nr:deoxyguanosinetriphosphate triphosphohydrolase [Anaerolineae bacterium]